MPVDERRYADPTPPSQFNVENLFKSNSRLIIPSWQREYAWSGENEVEDLLSDLSKFVENSHRDNYLLGSIITFPSGKDRVVVDGQQRTVTLFILLCALHTNLLNYLKADYPNGGVPESYQNTLYAIRHCIKNTTVDSKTFFPIVMEYGGGDSVLSSIADDRELNIDTSTGTQQRILEAYDYIKTYLNREYVDKNDLRSFAIGVMQGVFLSEIKVGDLRQALEVFIKLNNRGKDLEDSDLVKNYLFQQVKEENFEKISKKWSNMSLNLRKSQGKAKLRNAEFFLRNWALYKKGERLVGEYPVWEYWEKELDAEDEREAFLNQMEKKSQDFSNLIDSKFPYNGNDNLFMQGVKHLGSTQHLPLLLAGCHLEPNSFDYLSSLVNSRTVAYLLSLERTQDFESLVPIWANKISKLPINASKEQIDETVLKAKAFLSPGEVTNFKSYLSTLTYKQQKKKVKLVLGVVAVHYQSQISANDLTLSQFLNGYQVSTKKGFDIDHIHPRSKIPESDEQFDNVTLYEGLGNLVLVNGRQRDYADKPPIDKEPLFKEGYFITKCLTKFDPQADEKTRKEWERIQKEIPYSLSNWTREIIEKRRDFIIDEFIATMPKVIVGNAIETI